MATIDEQMGMVDRQVTRTIKKRVHRPELGQEKPVAVNVSIAVLDGRTITRIVYMAYKRQQRRCIKVAWKYAEDAPGAHPHSAGVWANKIPAGFSRKQTVHHILKHAGVL